MDVICKGKGIRKAKEGVSMFLLKPAYTLRSTSHIVGFGVLLPESLRCAQVHDRLQWLAMR